MNKENKTYQMLCHRCEHRALWWESKGKHRPRYECGEPESAKICCYMYQSCKPVVVRRADSAKDDPRPLAPGYFSARFDGVEIADCMPMTKEYEDGGTVFYWIPREDEE